MWECRPPATRPRSPAGLLDQLVRAPDGRHVPAYLTALVWSALGDRDRAFEALARAVEEREHWMVFLDVDQRFDPLRDDSRFAELRRRVGV